jgi:hypothetical protein
MGYPGREPGMVTRLDAAHWGSGLNDVDEVFPDRSATRIATSPVARERRYDETTTSELPNPHRIYMRFWPFCSP